jgi:hypothetical protein
LVWKVFRHFQKTEANQAEIGQRLRFPFFSRIHIANLAEPARQLRRSLSAHWNINWRTRDGPVTPFAFDLAAK